jgi:aromatic-L-amino-acid/L-tryptophan decarboxylase
MDRRYSAVAHLCSRESLWLHVDAAYGGFAVLTDRGRAALAGLGRADSVTLDPHKWLFMPFECGCLLVRKPRALAEAFRIYPEYLKDVESRGEEINFADYGEQLTRYSRALKVWLAVSYFGTAALGDAIRTGMDLAAHAERIVRADPGLEVLSPAQFGICCFRARGRGLAPSELDALNERILTRVNSGGRFFISSTRLRGAYSLRICVLGFRTTLDDVEGLIGEVSRYAKE